MVFKTKNNIKQIVSLKVKVYLPKSEVPSSS